MPTQAERRLAAILSADVVGYSRLMADDEDATIRAVTARREEVELHVHQHGGRLNDFTGDNFLAEFGSVVHALQCAVEIQRAVATLNAELPPEQKMEFRMGLHLGEIQVQDDRLFGTGVNVAARLEGLAEPGGICISAVVHEQLGNKLDLGYEDLGEHSVKNIPKPVGVYRVHPDGGREYVAKPARRGSKRRRVSIESVALLLLLVAGGLWLSWRAPLDLVPELVEPSGPPANPLQPGEPSIVVLPFDNLGDDPEQEYFADGITEDLTTDLSRYPGVFVIARNSAFTYKERPVRIEDVGRELGVRYAVEGSVRRAGDQIRISAQLIDTTRGLHVWAERYDRELGEIFELQDEIVTGIMESVGTKIITHEEERARRTPTEDLNAYQALMRGRHYAEIHTRGANAEARRWFERAIDLDPGYAEAHQWLGVTYVLPYVMGWDLDPRLLKRADEQARRCLELDPSHPVCHVGLAGVAVLGGSAADAIRYAERAIELGPSLFAGHFYLGMGRLRAGQPLKAIPSLERAIRLNPHGDSIAPWLAPAYVLVGRDREALEIYERATALNPDDVSGRIYLASYHEAAGDHARARVLVKEIRAVRPDLTVSQVANIVGFRTFGPERLSAMMENLRSAGLFDPVEAPAAVAVPYASDRPSIAVLPFCNLSGDPDQEYFADGVTEDLTATLSRSPDLLVISRSSSSRYACLPLDLKQVGRELGVRYAVEGSVRRAQDQVRITAKLIDATADVHVWSESYERDLSPTNVFEIQSDIAGQISEALQVQIVERIGERKISDPTTWDLYMRARYLGRRISSLEDALEVRRLYERAIELDPEFAPAYAGLAGLDTGRFAFGPERDTELLDRAETYARRSIALDPLDAWGHANLAAVLTHQGKREDALREAKRAVELNSSLAGGHFFVGMNQMRLGRLGEAKRSFDHLQKINPRRPSYGFWAIRGSLHYLEGEIEQAVSLWERARTIGSSIGPNRIMLAHYYESAGRHEDAQAIVQEMLSVQPEMTAERGLEMLARFWNGEWIPEDLEAHLRSAGLP